MVQEYRSLTTDFAEPVEAPLAEFAETSSTPLPAVEQGDAEGSVMSAGSAAFELSEGEGGRVR